MLGFRLPFYKTPTLLLSLGLSVRVLWYLILSRPDVIHASSPGLLHTASPPVASLHHVLESEPRSNQGQGQRKTGSGSGSDRTSFPTPMPA